MPVQQGMACVNGTGCLRYDLIDRPGVLGNYVPLNYHCLYDLSVLVEGFWLSLEHPKVCIICGAVETALSTQKTAGNSLPWVYNQLIPKFAWGYFGIISSDAALPIFYFGLTFCSRLGLGNEGGGPPDDPQLHTKLKIGRAASLDIMPKMPPAKFGINRVYTQGRKLPAVKHKRYMVFIY